MDYAKATCDAASRWYKENASLIAKIDCKRVTSCEELSPVLDACGLSPLTDVRKFENELAAQFAMSAQCRTVRYAVYEGPGGIESEPITSATSKRHYTLMLDYQPGARKQAWTAIRSWESSIIYQGEDAPEDIAEKVCLIATEQGARAAK